MCIETSQEISVETKNSINIYKQSCLGIIYILEPLNKYAL